MLHIEETENVLFLLVVLKVVVNERTGWSIQGEGASVCRLCRRIIIIMV